MTERSDGQPRRMHGLAEGMLNDDGETMCASPDDCEVCCLFAGRLPGETLAEWGERLERTVMRNQARRAR